VTITITTIAAIITYVVFIFFTLQVAYLEFHYMRVLSINTIVYIENQFGYVYQ